jgi:hypothetical protein
MVNGFLACTKESALLRELWYIFMYVTSDVIWVWTERERLPGGSLITVDINSVFLDTLASGKTVTLFSCCARVFGLKSVLKPQAILPFPPDIVLVGSGGSARRGRRGIIVLYRINAETITVAIA